MKRGREKEGEWGERLAGDRRGQPRNGDMDGAWFCSRTVFPQLLLRANLVNNITGREQ